MSNSPSSTPACLPANGDVVSYCVRLAPVSEATAMEMIAELPELKLIQGFRNLPRGDVAALARAIRSISLLACLDGDQVQEAEIMRRLAQIADRPDRILLAQETDPASEPVLGQRIGYDRNRNYSCAGDDGQTGFQCLLNAGVPGQKR